MMKPRVVVITNYSYAGVKVLDGLFESQKKVVGIFVKQQKLTCRRLLGKTRDRCIELFYGAGKHRGKYPIYSVNNINGKKTVEKIKNLKPDIICVIGGPIIKKKIITIPTKAIINFHTSILPKFRGLDTAFWMLYHNDPDAVGVTIHHINEKIDDGNIVLQQKTPCTMLESPFRLHIKNINYNYLLMSKAIDMLYQPEFKQKKQLGKKSYYSSATKNDKEKFKKIMRKRRNENI